MKTSPKDFFLNLGIIVTLYVWVVSVLNLIFSIINSAFPLTDYYNSNYGYYSSSPISWPVATLIIVFPIFILLSWLLEKDFRLEPEKRNLNVRRWLSYITLSLTGIAIVIDLVILLYSFLSGEILTISFVLKVVSVAVVSSVVFFYYISDIRGKLTSFGRNIYAWVSGLFILAMIISGFVVIGSPYKQRAIRVDSQRVVDLQNIQWQIVNYWQSKNILLSELTQLQDSISGFRVPTDPSGNYYEYRVLGDLSFELCANFDLPSGSSGYAPENRSVSTKLSVASPGLLKSWDSWNHDAGRSCFERNIDPDLYPPNL